MIHNNHIIEPHMDYDFSKLLLGIPVAHPNSTYVARIFATNKPLYIQTPKCTTRGGIIKSGKKLYCDLIFSADDSIFIDWITNLEAKCQSLIFHKSESWFQTAYSKDEIETAFSSSLKIYKAGKYYLLRVNVKPTIKIYTDLNVEVSFDDINEKTHMLNIIEFYGIKFTSRNFQIEVELKQSMIVNNDEFVENYFLKPQSNIQEQPRVQLYQQQQQPQQVSTVQAIAPLYLPREPDEPYVFSEILKEEQQEHKKQEQEQQEQHYTKEKTDIPPEITLEIKEEKEEDLAEFDFDSMLERLEETPLCLKRPTDQYYKEYNDVLARATKLKQELNRIYLEARTIKEKYGLNVDDIDKTIYSDVDISDNESDY